ncbi:MAG: branched-chain amino acid ABC transporter permease [Psychrobacillus psychrodurans]
MQIIVSGLMMGCIYALAAVGIVLIYKSTSVVNFAHGEIAMFTSFIAFSMLNNFQIPIYLTFILSICISALLGIVIYLFLMKRLTNVDPLNKVVLTLGMFLVVNGIAGFIWGYEAKPFPTLISERSVDFHYFILTWNEIFILGLTLIINFTLFIWLQFSNSGLAMRATYQDQYATKLMGVEINKVHLYSWGIGTGLGGLGGLLIAPTTFLSPNMMFEILILSFAAAVLGGFVNIMGVILGGVIIGVLTNLIGYYISAEMKIVYVFILIILVLYIKPQGILGGKIRAKKV